MPIAKNWIKWLSFLSTLFPAIAGAQVPDFHKRSFVASNGLELPYRIMFPAGYGQSMEKYPLLLFLHGAGERGNDNEAQLRHGAAFFQEQSAKFPAIVVMPQCPAESYWVNRLSEGSGFDRVLTFPITQEAMPGMQAVMELLDSLLEHEKIDPSRQYVGGLSMGAMGTYDLLSRRPTQFKAAIAICGGGNPALVTRYAPHTRLWLFHGAADDVVPVKYTRILYEALRQAGANVRYTEYPDVNHGSWTPALAEPGLMEWLFQK